MEDTTIAYIIRDSAGLMLKAGSWKIIHTSVLNAGLCAAWYDIKISLNCLQHQSMTLEGDNQMVINHVTRDLHTSYNIKPILKDILAWTDSFSQFSIMYVSCQVN